MNTQTLKMLSFHDLVFKSLYEGRRKTVFWGNIPATAVITLSLNVGSDRTMWPQSPFEWLLNKEHLLETRQHPLFIQMTAIELECLVFNLVEKYDSYDEFALACPPSVIQFDPVFAEYEHEFRNVMEYM